MYLKPSEEYYKLTGKKNLYNIMPIENMASVITNGILCFNKTLSTKHKSIAMNDVQERRSKITIPNGLPLHCYANLYFAYNNPMLYKRRNEAESFCILVISHNVLDIEGCILSDQNASTSLARFFTPYDGIKKLNFQKIFAKSWTNDDYYEYQRHKAIKCAEILIPDYIPYDYIIGAYVLNHTSEEKLLKQGFEKPIRTNATIFYR